MKTKYVVYNKTTEEYLLPLKDDLFTNRNWSQEYAQAEMYETVMDAHTALNSLESQRNDKHKSGNDEDGEYESDFTVLGVQLVEMPTAEELKARRIMSARIAAQLEVLMVGPRNTIHVNCADDGTITIANSFTQLIALNPEATLQTLRGCSAAPANFDKVWSALRGAPNINI